MKTCSKCGDEHNRKNQDYCLFCHAEYMRENRPKYGELTAVQKMKDNSRSHANISLRRGILTKEPCKYCGDENSEMHHNDYGKPKEVEWLCRFCHLIFHQKIEAGMTKAQIDDRYLMVPRLCN